MKQFLQNIWRKWNEQNEEDLPSVLQEEEAAAPVPDDFTLSPDDDTGHLSATFLNSLENLTEEDVPLAKAPAIRRKTPAELIRLGIFYVSAVCFVVSCILLADNLIKRQKGDAIYAELENDFFAQGFDFSNSSTAGSADADFLTQDSANAAMPSLTENLTRLEAGETEVPPEKKSHNVQLEKMRAGLSVLADKNPDIYGWIYVEGTNINYPLVQGEDNQYYLEHAYTGDYLPIGSIYVDYRNNRKIMRNYNTVMYGHNITSGSMFHDVTKFFDDEVFANTPIVICTFDGIFTYEAFAIYESRYDNNYFKTGFTSGQDFLDFIEKIKGDATKWKDIEFTKNDRIITMSTCTNGAATQRYALHARLVSYVTE